MPNTLTVEEVAATLHVSDQTVWQYIKEGKLNASKVGRRWLIDPASVQALLPQPKIEPKPENATDK